MGFVPSDAEWFLGDVVVAISVQGDPRVVVHYGAKVWTAFEKIDDKHAFFG